MVASNRFSPKARKLIDQFATDPGSASLAPPFVELPASVGDFEALMRFDRETCTRHRAFRRRLHPNEFPAMPVNLHAAIVTVTEVAQGLRTRVVTETVT